MRFNWSLTILIKLLKFEANLSKSLQRGIKEGFIFVRKKVRHTFKASRIRQSRGPLNLQGSIPPCVRHRANQAGQSRRTQLPRSKMEFTGSKLPPVKYAFPSDQLIILIFDQRAAAIINLVRLSRSISQSSCLEVF